MVGFPIPPPSTPRLWAPLGFDYVVIDTQHGAIDYSAMLPMLQVLSIGSIHSDGPRSVLRFGPHRQGTRRRRAGRDRPAWSTIEPPANRPCLSPATPPAGERSYGPTRAVLVEVVTITSTSLVIRSVSFP